RGGADSTRCRSRSRGRHVPRPAAGGGNAVARRPGGRRPGGPARVRQGDDTTEPREMSAGATLALVRAVPVIRHDAIPADALEVGIELECRLGELLGPGHYAAGFHATATVGAFGAAAACAHLLGLDEELWLHALGIAGTQAAGLKSAFGSMAKPLHAGRAA